MKPQVAIYLAGTIKKEHESRTSHWTEDDLAFLEKSLQQYNVFFLNPALRTDNLSDQHSVFGRDMLQVFCSHVVFVDARDRRGLGVGAEMMWAKLNRIPVVTWAPENTHYHKSQTTILGVSVNDYVHPFVESLSDKIVSTLAEGARWIEQYMKDPATIKIKRIEHIHAAMEYYKDQQLHQDLPMKTLYSLSAEIAKRMDNMTIVEPI